MNLKNHSLKASCSNCKTEVRFTVEDATTQRTTHCSGCGSEIRLIDKNGATKETVGKIQNQLDNLAKKF